MHYLLKFGYDGRMFTGYQRGNGDRSVEGSILSVLERYGIAKGFSSAARTDRGVSAAGNVIFLSSGMAVDDIIGILNSQIRHVIFHSYAVVNSDFRVRFSSMKHYRYNLNAEGLDMEKFSVALKKFTGTHDFSLFSRKDSRTPVRTVEKITVLDRDEFLEVNVYGPNFVWNQIRAMVGFARYYSLQVGELPDPFEVIVKKWALAEPEPLVLMDIEYKGVEFIRYVGHKTARLWKRTIDDLKLHSTVLSNIYENAAAGS